FLEHHGWLARLWGPLIGPLVAVLSFVCSIGNVPLAAVLWNGGISFGGVLAFIFADLLVLPVLDIYRKYYGWRGAGLLGVAFHARTVPAARAPPPRFPGLGVGAGGTERQGRDGLDLLELHHRSEHRLPDARRRALGPVRPHRRPAHAPHDGQARGARMSPATGTATGAAR